MHLVVEPLSFWGTRYPSFAKYPTCANDTSC